MLLDKRTYYRCAEGGYRQPINRTTGEKSGILAIHLHQLKIFIANENSYYYNDRLICG